MPGEDGRQVVAPNLERLQWMGSFFTSCFQQLPAPVAGEEDAAERPLAE